MKRFWIGLGFLIALLVSGIGISMAVDRAVEPVSAQLSQALELAQSGAQDQALALAKQAQADWQDHWNLIATICDHSPMEEIDTHFAELEAYGQAQETSEFAATCAALARQVQAVSQAHSSSWWNLA